MTDSERAPESKSHASSGPQHKIIRLDERRAAAIADREHVLEERAKQKPYSEEEAQNPLALGLALAVILALLLGSWFLINQLKCDPLYSDAGLSHSRVCR
jgi:hypothetical protein